MRRIFREPFLEERVLELSKELLRIWGLLPQALLRPYVLWAALEKI